MLASREEFSVSNSTSPIALLVMNNANYLQVLKPILRQMGYRIATAPRVIDGLDVARKASPALIITEVELSDLTGRELAATLRADARFLEVPILTILPPHDHEQRDICLATGMNGFLDEPLDPQLIPVQVQFYTSGGTDTPESWERMENARDRYVLDIARRLEIRIRELETKNAELQRLDEMKDAVIMLTAHELRTPLTIISGYSRLLEDDPLLRQFMQKDEGLKALISGLGEGITRLHSVIEEILTISRIMTSKIEINVTPINLGALVERVIVQYREAVRERNLVLEVNELEFLTMIRGDEALLYQMFSALLSNAIKYTPNGGRIILHASSDGDKVRVSVQDTGIGIAPESHEKIFEKLSFGGDVAFHTTSKTQFMGGGLGLGLAICRGIIEAHGGKIWLESVGYDPKTCPGSTFYVTLPAIAVANTQPLTKIKRLATRS